ncbi:MAG: YgiT-type zinc finger protein [Betaproteobacteria bacterium]|nr:YgiT-type zinc finger protein [Betaproteobacteria bacterium]
MDADARAAATCASCGSADVEARRVRSAFWHDDRLVVVEDIPALVCGACGEHSYEDYTVIVLDLLRGGGFPADKARGELRAAVFSFFDGVAEKGES